MIAFEEVPLADAIRSMARQMQLSVQVDPAADLVVNQAWVTGRYTNRTMLAVLESVLQSNRLQLVKVPGTNVAGVTRR